MMGGTSVEVQVLWGSFPHACRCMYVLWKDIGSQRMLAAIELVYLAAIT